MTFCVLYNNYGDSIVLEENMGGLGGAGEACVCFPRLTKYHLPKLWRLMEVTSDVVQTALYAMYSRMGQDTAELLEKCQVRGLRRCCLNDQTQAPYANHRWCKPSFG